MNNIVFSIAIIMFMMLISACMCKYLLLKPRRLGVKKCKAAYLGNYHNTNQNLNQNTTHSLSNQQVPTMPSNSEFNDFIYGNLVWGDTPLSILPTTDHNLTDMEYGSLPVNNSKSAIKRMQAEARTFPWDPRNWEKDSCKSEPDSSGGEFVDQFLEKKHAELSKFGKSGFKNTATAVRHMGL